MSEKLPWFPFYAQAWLTDEHVRMMPRYARSCYMDLLCCQFVNGGIPNDATKCARLLGESPQEFEQAWPEIRDRFEPMRDDPTRLQNPHLARVADEQRERRDALVESGRRGGLAKAARLATLEGGYSHPSSPLLADPPSHPPSIRVERDKIRKDDLTPQDSLMRLSHSAEAERPHPAVDSPPENLERGAAPPPAAAPPREPTQERFDLTAEERARVNDVLNAAWPIIKDRHPEMPMDATRWRSRNRGAARSLVRAGKKPEHVVAALACAYEHPVSVERTWDTITMLNQLEARWVQLQGIARGTVRAFGEAASNGVRQDKRARASRGASD